MLSAQLFIFLLLVVVFNVDASPRPQSNGEDEPLLEVPKNYSNLKIPKGRSRLRFRGSGRTEEGPPIVPVSDSTPIPNTEGQSSSNITSKAFGPIPPSDQPAPERVFPTEPQFVPFAVPVDDNGTAAFTTFTTQIETVDPGEGLEVDVVMQIQSIRDINEVEQKIIIEIDLTVHWKDYDFLPEDESYIPPDEEMENVSWLLQNFKSKALPSDEFDRLWKPDIFIERVVKVTKPGLLASPITVRTIRKTSSIVYTMRASVHVDCNMDFQYYPADTQHCILDMRSYQNDETLMRLHWNPVPGAYLVDTDSDDNFDVKLSYAAQRKKKVKNINLEDAIFDVLQVKLSMRRRLTYHLLQTYIPSAFLVFITWLSFLIPEDLIEARIGISMTTLLTLTAMFAAVRENTPVVSYIRAIDIWMVYCIFIVFGTLLEFTFFVWLRNYKIAKREQKLQNLVCEVPLKEMGENKTEPKDSAYLPNLEDITTTATKAFEHTAKIFNQFAFGFFVLNFIIFSLIYWPWLMISSEHYQWVVNSTLNGHPEDTNNGFIDTLEQ